MDKAQSRPDEMTGIERDFLKIGILSKCYSYCKRVIEERNLCYFEKKRTAIEPLDIMVFNYYKGFLYCALKEFPKAVKAFQLVLAQPTNIFHHCLIQAYKKLVLSSLLMEKVIFPVMTKLIDLAS
jgi:COP9 signalosome complex subunit 3